MNKLIKNLFLIPLLALSFLSSTNVIQAESPIYTPQNSAFFFDVDDVILDKSSWTIFGIMLKHYRTAITVWWNAKQFDNPLPQKGATAEAWKEWGRNNYPALEEFINDIQQSKTPNMETIAIVEKLLDKEFDLYEATNMGTDEFAEHKKKNRFFERFKAGKTVNYKAQPIIKKPNPKYFAELTELAPNIEYKIFIDDKLKNVEAARQAGFIGIHFTTAEQLEADLIGMGIVVNEHPKKEKSTRKIPYKQLIALGLLFFFFKNLHNRYASY
ncbi:MAG TPA: hypothetical protein VGT41_02480 [Candidatus Babeliales bacterium]|nr:hypothetical protein [Candidatus Babeliales bacterium]